MGKGADFGLSEELEQVEQELFSRVRSNERTIEEVCRYVIGAGGKRLRPVLLLLSYRAAGGQDHREIVPLAAAVELIHTATLIHDDINDGSALRRGRETPSIRFGTTNALIAGDFLFAKGFEIGGMYGQEVVKLTAETSFRLAESEIFQFRNRGNPDLTESEYLGIIEGKTARIFSDGARIGATLAKAPEPMVSTLAEYGLNLGMAFQITDDILDFTGTEEKLGKPPGMDISEGKLTLPTIYALSGGTDGDRDLLTGALRATGNGPVDLGALTRILDRTGALEKARSRARDYVDRAIAALEDLPSTTWKDRLGELAEYVVARET